MADDEMSLFMHAVEEEATSWKKKGDDLPNDYKSISAPCVL